MYHQICTNGLTLYLDVNKGLMKMIIYFILLHMKVL